MYGGPWIFTENVGKTARKVTGQLFKIFNDPFYLASFILHDNFIILKLFLQVQNYFGGRLTLN